MQFLFGQYIKILKKEIGHNQKRTTLEPMGIVGIVPMILGRYVLYPSGVGCHAT